MLNLRFGTVGNNYVFAVKIKTLYTMKRILYVLFISFTIMLTACGGLSTKQKELVEESIKQHNAGVRLKNSLQRAKYQKEIDEFELLNKQLKEVGTNEDIIKGNNRLIENLQIQLELTGKSSDIKTDSAVTYDQYIDYCKKYDRDPIEFLEDFRVKN